MTLPHADRSGASPNTIGSDGIDRPRGIRASTLAVSTSLWFAYFALSPVAWLPGIPTGRYSLFKSALLGLAIASTWVAARKRSFPTGLAGPWGLALVGATSVFAVLQATSDRLAARRMGELVVAFVILWTLYVFSRNGGRLATVAAWAAVVHGLLSAVIIVVYANGLTIPTPAEIAVNGAGGLTIIDTGFSHSRTFWSNSVSLLIPFAVAVAVGPRRWWIKAVMWGAVLSTLGGQVVTAGRAGIGISLLSIAVVVTFRWGVRGLGGFTVASLGSGLLLMQNETLSERLRRDHPESSGLVDFFNGRFSHWRIGVDWIFQRPLLGHGFGVPFVEAGADWDHEIHNMWLRLGAEGGLLLVASLAAVVVSIVARGFQVTRSVARSAGRDASLVPAAFLTVLGGGLLISFVEPNIFLGTPHPTVDWLASAGITAIWWASAGALLAFDEGSSPSSPSQ